MVSTPLTLAALATSAVPELVVTGTRSHTSGSGGAFTSAVLATDQGDVIVRVPTHGAAEVQQSAELLGLSAFSDAARAALPFAVPRTLGLTRAGDTKAVVSTFLPGAPANLSTFEADPELLRAAAESIAAIHALPTGIIREAGLPIRDPREARLAAARIVRRAGETGMLPATVQRRWDEVLNAEQLWSFEAVVVHGALAPELILLDAQGITGVLGWGELSTGDPASDLAWLLDADEELFATALAWYASKRGLSGQRELTARARFLHELEVAKWLLHGIDSHDQEIVDDAVSMCDTLVDRLSILGTAVPKREIYSERDVEQMLHETPRIEHDPRSETAEFESLDEDRAFGESPASSQSQTSVIEAESTHNPGTNPVRSSEAGSAGSTKPEPAGTPQPDSIDDPDAETGVLDDVVASIDRATSRIRNTSDT